MIKKFLSAFLALVMLFALIPTQVFAGPNMDYGTSVSNGGTANGNFYRQGDANGYRVSVYFAQQIGSKVDSKGIEYPVYGWPNNELGKEVRKNDDYFKIGQSYDLRSEYLGDTPAFYGTNDVFEYITEGAEFRRKNTGTYNWYLMCEGWDTTDLLAKRETFINKYMAKAVELKNLYPGEDKYDDLYNMLMGIDKLDASNNKLPEFFKDEWGEANIRDTKWVKGFFTHPSVLEQIAYLTATKAKVDVWHNYNFYEGTYVKNGIMLKGQFKLYIEPLYYACYGTNNYGAMTLREMIASYKANSNISPLKGDTGARQRAVTLGKALKLEEIDYSLMFAGTDVYAGTAVGGKLPEYGSQVLGQIDSVSDPLMNYGGVGVISSPTTGSVGGTKIVRSYVEVESYTKDANGNIIVNYKEAAPSDVSKAIVSEKGTISLYPPVRTKENVTYVLNDVIVTTKDITNGKVSGAVDVKWENTLPQSSQGKVDLNKQEVSSFLFGNVESADGVKSEVEKMMSEEVKPISGSDINGALVGVAKSNPTAKGRMATLAITNPVLFALPATYPLFSVMSFNYNTEIAPGINDMVNSDSIGYKTNAISDLNNITVQEEFIAKNVPESDVDKGTSSGGVEEGLEQIPDSDEVVASNKNSGTFTETVTITNKKADTKSTEHIVYVRYLIAKKPQQINIVTTKDNGKVVGNPKIFTNDLSVDTGITTLKDITKDPEYSNATLINWYSNKEFNTITIPTTPGSKSGTTLEPIASLPVEENVYVFWEIEKGKPKSANYDVPEWRLSTYWNNIKEGPDYTGMSLLGINRSSCCCGGSAYLNGSEWPYILVNPNKTLITNSSTDNTPSSMKVNSWLHSRAITMNETDSVSLGNPNTSVRINGNLNAIKSSETSSLIIANWLNKESLNGLTTYDLVNGNLPSTKKVNNSYTLSGSLSYQTKNSTTYTNGWYVCNCYEDDDDGHVTSYTHGSYTYDTALNAPNVEYDPYTIKPNVTFRRYNQQNTDAKKFVTSPEVKSENGKTTLKYQVPNKDIKVYPEYGMLFANDNPTDTNHETIKWVVGDQARLINPVVYQTLEHKVYVVPTSTGIGATDSRAITNARKIGEANKQVFYKGSAVTTAFKLQRGENDTNKGILTVKTFALDIDNSTLKSAWGNTGYNSLEQHTLLTNKVANTNVKGTEKLLIDSPLKRVVEYSC